VLFPALRFRSSVAVSTCSVVKVRKNTFIRKNSVVYVKNNVLRFRKFAVAVDPFIQNCVLFFRKFRSCQAWSSSTRKRGKLAGQPGQLGNSTRPFGTTRSYRTSTAQKREMVSIVYVPVMRTRRGNGNGNGSTETDTDERERNAGNKALHVTLSLQESRQSTYRFGGFSGWLTHRVRICEVFFRLITSRKHKPVFEKTCVIAGKIQEKSCFFVL